LARTACALRPGAFSRSDTLTGVFPLAGRPSDPVGSLFPRGLPWNSVPYSGTKEGRHAILRPARPRCQFPDRLGCLRPSPRPPLSGCAHRRLHRAGRRRGGRHLRRGARPRLYRGRHPLGLPGPGAPQGEGVRGRSGPRPGPAPGLGPGAVCRGHWRLLQGPRQAARAVLTAPGRGGRPAGRARGAGCVVLERAARVPGRRLDGDHAGYAGQPACLPPTAVAKAGFGFPAGPRGGLAGAGHGGAGG